MQHMARAPQEWRGGSKQKAQTVLSFFRLATVRRIRAPGGREAISIETRSIVTRRLRLPEFRSSN